MRFISVRKPTPINTFHKIRSIHYVSVFVGCLLPENIYTYLRITDTKGIPCKLRSQVSIASVQAVCIKFRYATTGAGEHGINVGFEDDGRQMDLFSVPPGNTGGEWHEVGASCCLRGQIDRYVSRIHGTLHGWESLPHHQWPIINQLESNLLKDENA